MNRAVQLALAVFFAVVLVPILGARNVFYLEVIFQIAVFSALALGLNIVVGFSGLLNFGYMAFYAVGAYLWGFFGSQQPVPAARHGHHQGPQHAVLPGPGLVLPVHLPGRHRRRHHRPDPGPAGAAGAGRLPGHDHPGLRRDRAPAGQQPGQAPELHQRAPGHHPDPAPDHAGGRAALLQHVVQPIVGHRVTDNQAYNILFYLIALLVVVAVIVITYRLDDSKVGRAWTAIREDELSAGAMGINANKLKLGAFAVGASFAGAMGVLFAASRTFVSPETFTFLQSVGVLTMVILGGIGSITGVIVGATLVTLLNIQVLQSFSLYLSQLRQSDAVIPLLNWHWSHLSNQLDPTKYQRLIFGILLVVMMIYRPTGLLPAARRKRELASLRGRGPRRERSRACPTTRTSSPPGTSTSASAA